MMNVLMCGNHPTNKGGMTSVINQILERDWSVEGVSLSFIPTYLPGNKIKTFIYFMFSYIRIVLRFLFNRPDVLYTHMSIKGSYSRTRLIHFICKVFRVKDIIHLHGSEFKKWYESVSEGKKRNIVKLIEECNVFIVLGNEWEKYVTNIAPDSNIVQVHNCVRIPNIGLKKRDNTTRFLYLGVLIPRKGVIDLLRAVKEINQTTQENLSFDIVGTGPDENKLKEYVKENGLDRHVRFLGWLSGEERNKAIQKADVLILPSYNEGLPVCILEAMSYGLAIISTDVGDIRDAVFNNENGYLYKPGDINELVRCIYKMLDRDEQDRMSKKSRKIIEEYFDIEIFYKKLLSIWENLLKSEKCIQI